MTSKAAALNRFISQSSNKYKPFFQLPKKATNFLWTDACKVSLADLKRYLTTPLVLSNLVPREELFLYLAVLDYAVSVVVIREE